MENNMRLRQGNIRNMRHLIILFFLIGFPSAESTNQHSPAEPFFLSRDSATCFFSDHEEGAFYLKFKPDGRYILIAKEHMGVWPVDSGGWNQSSDGVVTLTSKILCADILSGDLEVSVGNLRRTKQIPKLINVIDRFLQKTKADSIFEKQIKRLRLRGDLALEVEIDWRSHRSTVSRSELQLLRDSMVLFITDSSFQHKKILPLTYKGFVFLINLNNIIDRDHREVCNAIDSTRNGQVMIDNMIKISEEAFNSKTSKPYPFKFYPEMNKVTGAEK